MLYIFYNETQNFVKGHNQIKADTNSTRKTQKNSRKPVPFQLQESIYQTIEPIYDKKIRLLYSNLKNQQKQQHNQIFDSIPSLDHETVQFRTGKRLMYILCLKFN